MQMYAEEAVAKHMNFMQKIMNSQDNIKSGAVWKDHENILEAAMKQSDRWHNMKKDGANEDEIKASFKQKSSM
jgi:penicillin-binding protein 1A